MSRLGLWRQHREIRLSVELQKGRKVGGLIDGPYWWTIVLIRESSITRSWKYSEDGMTEGIDRCRCIARLCFWSVNYFSEVSI